MSGNLMVLSTLHGGKHITELILFPCSWLHVADTHSASCQFVMLLKWLFLASSPMWEEEKKEQGQLERRRRGSSWLPGWAESPSLHGHVPGNKCLMDVPNISCGTQPSPRVVLWNCSAWLWARVGLRGGVGPKGPHLWKIRAGKGHKLLHRHKIPPTKGCFWVKICMSISFHLPSKWSPSCSFTA